MIVRRMEAFSAAISALVFDNRDCCGTGSGDTERGADLDGDECFGGSVLGRDGIDDSGKGFDGPSRGGDRRSFLVFESAFAVGWVFVSGPKSLVLNFGFF